jgi:tetratricopeptide (TPR) repeat protein
MTQSKWLYPALIMVVGAVVYANSLANGFTFDDWPLVVHNPLVDQMDVGAIFSSAYWPQKPELGLYRPLTILSYAINQWILGEGAWGFHIVNLVLHSVNAMLVFFCARKFFERSVAGICAFIFLCHPLQTEAVNSVVGRAELLAAFWMLVAWFVFLHDVGWRRWVLVSGAILLGCLCKEHAVTMVGIVAVASFAGLPNVTWGREGVRVSFMTRWARFCKEDLLGMLLCVGAVGLFLVARYAVVGGVLLPSQPTFVDNPLAHVESWERRLTALHVIWHYAKLMVWAGDLSADYSYQAIPIVSSFWTGTVLGGVGVFYLLGLFIVSTVRGNSPPIWGLIASWMLLPFLPVSNLWFPIGTIMAERLMYVPMVGYAILGGFGFWGMKTKWPRYAWVIAVILLALWSKKTVQRNADWYSDYTLFASAVEAAPQSAKAHFNLGNAVRDSGDLQGALPHYHRALWIYPNYAEVSYNIGVIQQELGHIAEALTAYQNVLSVDTTHVNAWTNVGILFAEKGLPDKAVEAFEKAVQLAPERTDVRFNYALTLQKSNRLDEARARYLQLLAQAPHHEDAALNLAQIYMLEDDVDAAIEVLNRVVRANPLAYQAALNLGALFEKRGRVDEAIDAMLLGVKGTEKSNVLALFALARLYGQQGKLDEARGALRLFLDRWNGEDVFKVRAQNILKQLYTD